MGDAGFFTLLTDGKGVIQLTKIAENVMAEEKDGLLVLTIDTRKPGTLSATGKSMVIASTRGNVPVAGGSLGLNFYKKRV